LSQQLPLKFKLEGHTRLDDYVGSAGARLMRLHGLVYIYGMSGSGKSHLLQGICHESQDRGHSAIYLPSLGILEPSVLDSLEAVDLVCLDDVDDVMGLADWQQALFHLVNAMKDSGRKLVLSGSTSVAGLKIGLADLDSRLKSAFLLQTDQLDDDQKLEVVRRKAQRRGFDMSDEVCRYILARSRRDLHHLAQLVEQLDEETLRQQKKVTIPFVRQALGL
jgi:DnaA family protein